MSSTVIQSKIHALKTCLRDMRYRTTWKEEQLANGDPAHFLIIFNFLLLQYNQKVSEYLVSKGYLLQTATDLEFIQQTFKFISSEFSYKIPISVTDFFKQKYALQKLNLTYDIAKLIRDKAKVL